MALEVRDQRRWSPGRDLVARETPVAERAETFSGLWCRTGLRSGSTADKVGQARYPGAMRVLQKNMKFFLRSLKSIAWLICALGTMTILTALPSYADECGTDARVRLPSCANVQSFAPDGSYVATADNQQVVVNSCSEPITIKIDRSGKADSLLTIQPGAYIKDKIYPSSVVSCCPKYSRCAY